MPENNLGQFLLAQVEATRALDAAQPVPTADRTGHDASEELQVERFSEWPDVIEWGCDESVDVGADYHGSPIHGAMSLVYRAPNGDEVHMPEIDFGNVSNQPTDESLGERVLAQVLAVESQPSEYPSEIPKGGCFGTLISMSDGTMEATQRGSFDDDGNMIYWDKPVTFTVQKDREPANYYGTDAADGSGLINNLPPYSPQTEAELYQDLERTARYCSQPKSVQVPWYLYGRDEDGNPIVVQETGFEHIAFKVTVESDVSRDSALQKASQRWQRHTVEVKDSEQHVAVPDVREPGARRWIHAVVGAVIALVVIAALCADFFGVLR